MHGDAAALSGLSGMSAFSGGAGPLLFDQFTGANGTDLASHAIAPSNVPAASWTVVSGTLAIQSNRVAISGSGYNLAAADAGVADCTVQTIVNDQGPGRDSYAGAVARCSDANNYWTMSILSATLVGIMEVNASVYTVRASGAFASSTGTDYTLALVCAGSTLTGKVNGSTLCAYGSAANNQAVTKHGLQGYFGAGTYNQIFDDFQVTVP